MAGLHRAAGPGLKLFTKLNQHHPAFGASIIIHSLRRRRTCHIAEQNNIMAGKAMRHLFPHGILTASE